MPQTKAPDLMQAFDDLMCNSNKAYPEHNQSLDVDQETESYLVRPMEALSSEPVTLSDTLNGHEDILTAIAADKAATLPITSQFIQDVRALAIQESLAQANQPAARKFVEYVYPVV